LADRYSFTPRRGYWFTYFLIKELETKRGCFKATLDIGVSWIHVCVENNTLYFDHETLKLDEVTPRREDHVVFLERDTGRIYEVVRSVDTGYYKLKAIAVDKAPTLEINGIHMHRVVGIDPWSDAKLKVKRVGVRRGDIVLDTCLGLGYTALNALIKRASRVYSVEIDENVLWVAERNPWSRMLSSESVVIIRGDVTEEVKRFDDNYFDKIIHDPPRYSSATGDLYSLEFYRELYRILKPGGKLYHYTGEPGRHRGFSIVKGIGERLRQAGFYSVTYDKETQGYIALKPYV